MHEGSEGLEAQEHASANVDYLPWLIRWTDVLRQDEEEVMSELYEFEMWLRQSMGKLPYTTLGDFERQIALRLLDEFKCRKSDD